MLIGNTVTEFLQSWYGPPNRDTVPPRGHEPLALREWWSYEAAWNVALARQNSVLPPRDIYRDAGHSVFYVENQAVWLWAYGEGNDPDVYDRENEPGTQWTRVEERLSTFLHHAAVFEAVLGAERLTLAANDAEGSVVRGVLENLSSSPFIDWRWPGPRSNVWEGDDCLVFACVNDRPWSAVDDASPWTLFVAGKTARALSAFDSFGIGWDYESR